MRVASIRAIWRFLESMGVFTGSFVLAFFVFRTLDELPALGASVLLVGVRLRF